VVGAGCYLATQFTFVTATNLTTAANAIFLQYTAPLFVALLGWLFLRERPRRADWLTMPLIFAGLLLFLGEGLSLEGMTGNVLGVVSAVTLAGMMICTRGQGGLPIRTFLIGMIAGALIGLPSLLSETITAPDVLMVTYLGVFQMGLALVFYSLGILVVPALEATLLLTLEPVLNPVWVFLTIGEAPGPAALVGGALVLAAVILRAVLGAREAH
jgi:drug/metabolite transporter (DMT)-like permease